MTLIIGKAAGEGIKIDPSNPDFGWKDMLGQITPRVGGGTAPTLGAFRGTVIKTYNFNVADVIDNILFHIPHDYMPNTDMFLHIHWGHNGTAISGSFNINWFAQYAKGYSQQPFASELTIPQSISTPNVATYPQYAHNITEFQITNTGGDTTHIDKGIIEVDGMFIISLEVTAIPTITGGSPNRPYIFMVDLHYQSTEVATKNRNYPFYT